MNAELVLIANSRLARLFSRDADNGTLVPLATLEQPDAHVKPSATGGSRPGHGSSDSRPGGVAFEPRLDPQRKADLQFAHAVAARLDQVLAERPAAHVGLFASNPFLGELRGVLSERASRRLAAAVNLDLTSYGLDEVEHRVAKALAPAGEPGPAA